MFVLLLLVADPADPIVTLSAASYTAFESETSVEVCAALNLLPSEFPSGLPAPITVQLSTSDGTAGTYSYMYINLVVDATDLSDLSYPQLNHYRIHDRLFGIGITNKYNNHGYSQLTSVN